VLASSQDYAFPFVFSYLFLKFLSLFLPLLFIFFLSHTHKPKDFSFYPLVFFLQRSYAASIYVAQGLLHEG
jgi:hypothetical protein